MFRQRKVTYANRKAIRSNSKPKRCRLYKENEASLLLAGVVEEAWIRSQRPRSSIWTKAQTDAYIARDHE